MLTICEVSNSNETAFGRLDGAFTPHESMKAWKRWKILKSATCTIYFFGNMAFLLFTIFNYD